MTEYKKYDAIAKDLKDYLNKFRNQDTQEILNQINTEISVTLNDYKLKFENKEITSEEVEQMFCSEKIKGFVKNSSAESPKIKIGSFSNILMFTERWTKRPQDTFKDYYCLLTYKKGYNEVKLAYNSTNNGNGKHPLSKQFLSDFFKNDTYLYVLSEEMSEVGKETKVLDVFFPKIDVLVLSRLGERKFELKNCNNRKNHGLCTIEWVDERRMNAFQFVFNQSRRKLILRFSLPLETFRNNQLNIIMGMFLITEESGKVEAGTAILERNSTGNTLEPFQFLPLRTRPNLVPQPIKSYLCDGRLNWLKLPSDPVYDLKSLDRWIVRKNKKLLTRKKPTRIRYLVTFPISSPKDKNFGRDTVATLNECFSNFSTKNHISHEVESLFRNDEKFDSMDELTKSIDYYLKRRNSQILIYPETRSKIQSVGPRTVNKEMLGYMSESMNIVFIVPNFSSNDYERISSIYTMIGYSIALGKHTFVLFNDINTLPFALQESNPDLKLSVWQYEKLEEIPFLFHYKMPKEE